MRLKPIGAAVACIALACLASPVAASADEARSVVHPAAASTAVDISDTSAGQQLIDAAISRFQASSIDQASRMPAASASAYVAYTNVPGDIPDAVWIIPVGGELPEVSLTDGVVTTTMRAEAPPLPPSDVELRTVAAAPSVYTYAASCASRYYKKVGSAQTGWMDQCLQWEKVVDDADPANEHWALKNWATCKSMESWRLAKCGHEVKQNIPVAGAAGLLWEDWAPRSDTEGSCRSINLSVSLFGIGVGGSYNGCERNDITKGEAAGSFASYWVGSVYMSEREVAFKIAVTDPVWDGVGPALTIEGTMETTLNI